MKETLVKRVGLSRSVRVAFAFAKRLRQRFALPNLQIY
jgi:hypothetical protein